MKKILFALLLGLTSSLSYAQGTAPVVVTNKFVARGVTAALGRSTVTGDNITEEGFCWSSETKNPTINDSKTTSYYERRGKIFRMEGLTAATFYYVRAYAINSSGEVGYGDVVKIVTLPGGNTSYTYTANNASTAETKRITAALDEVVSLYNTWQGLKGLTIKCSYNSGVATADCSYGGSMRMGANASYQRTGTVLHETNHAVGVGQHTRWTNCSDLRADRTKGLWLGERANQVLHFLEGNDESTVTGDVTHMWATGGSPLAYGINGASEDTGAALQYIGNVLITHALGEDGLTPTYSYDNGYPYYSVDVEDTLKYYIKGVDEANGEFDSYASVASDGTIVLSTTPNDSAAWYISFDATKGEYRFKNVATGQYLTHTSQNFREVLIAKDVVGEPSTPQLFQLMPCRQDVSVGKAGLSYTGRPLNFCFESYNGMTTSNGRLVPQAFQLSNDATQQHWFILNEEEMNKFQRIKNNSVVDSLFIGEKCYDAFDVEQTQYNVAISPESTSADWQIRAVLNSHFNGSVEVEQADTIPGFAVLTLKNAYGSVYSTYTINLYPNIVHTWDANGATGSSSKPNKWGWGSTSTYSAIFASANGMNTHYMDPGKGTTYPYSDYIYGENAYEHNRMLMLNFLAGTETYYYKFTGLKPNTDYDVSLGVAWATNETETTPSMSLEVVDSHKSDTIPQLNSNDASVLINEICPVAETAKYITPYEYKFTTPSDITETSEFVLQFKSNGKCRLVLTDLSVFSLGSADISEDVNQDGTVDSQDVLKVYEYMKSAIDSPSSSTREDVNKDGKADSQDVLKLYEYMKAH